MVVADGGSLYEPNVVNQYFGEVFESPKFLPDYPKERAYARIWMASADNNFFPAVFVASFGRERGFSEAQVAEALETLRKTLTALEERLDGREYLAGGFSLADVAHADNFVRLRELAEEGELWLSNYPNVRGWIERIEARESFKAAG